MPDIYPLPHKLKKHFNELLAELWWAEKRCADLRRMVENAAHAIREQERKCRKENAP